MEIVARMVAGEPRFVCTKCLVPVYLVSRREQHVFYFRHRHEDGSCPAQTRSPLDQDQIRALKYHGLRESEPHKRVKALVLQSLEADEAFSEVLSERNWTNKEGSAFRRPDVQANHKSGKLAFEVQLSTTFLSVVVGRREFYKNEGALLIWVFSGFDPDYRLLTTNDVLFPNNSNAFVVDDETARISKESGTFHLRCHYRKPIREGDEITDCWEERIAPFHELTQDRERQRAYLFDYSGTEAQLRADIAEEKCKAGARLDVRDRDEFKAFWFAHGRRFKHTPENRAEWQELSGRFARRGISLPLYPDSDRELSAMLNTLYSLGEGFPVIWKFEKLVQIAHLLADHHPRQLIAFGHAARIYKRQDQLAKEDSSGKWSKRLADGLSARLHAFEPSLRPDPAMLPLMYLLFPEVAVKVEGYLDRAAEGNAEKS